MVRGAAADVTGLMTGFDHWDDVEPLSLDALESNEMVQPQMSKMRIPAR